MIDFLDQEVVAKESKVGSYELLPKGDYTVKLISVSDWKSREGLEYSWMDIMIGSEVVGQILEE